MDIKSNMLKNELNLSIYASYNKDAIRLKKEDSKDDIRGEYFRDIDRIIHSLSFTRYNDKTQVYSNTVNDHISKRIIHVQLVSKIARTIGRALNLNEDLIEAISLGHDLGHVPFGHVGEKILSDISLKHNEGYFLHNVQSVRNLLVLENKNITIQVLDGILCHNGEKLLKKYIYKNKNIDEFMNDYNKSYSDMKYANNVIPMTLEGAVVRISDIIGYIGRDLEDAIILKKIRRKDIPEIVVKNLGVSNKNIVNNLILDIINNSFEKNYIMLSDDKFNALNELIKFNYNNIYLPANSSDQILEFTNMFNVVFDKCLYILNNKLDGYNIYTHYLSNMSEEYLNEFSNERIVLDYIAGMTDNYFLYEYNILKKI